jgi:hypothetical protein
MTEAKGGGGELRAVVTITRKDTGKVEEYEITGHATDEQIEQLKEQHHVNTQHSSPKRGN